MSRKIVIDSASEADINDIMAILQANSKVATLIQRPTHELRRYVGDFIVARNSQGRVIGCAALHVHSSEYAEIFSVAVIPYEQRKGIGQNLISVCHKRAKANNIKKLWLATQKPEFFAKFGYRPIGLWNLPFYILLAKFTQVLRRPPRYWLYNFRHKQIITQLDLE